MDHAPGERLKKTYTDEYGLVGVLQARGRKVKLIQDCNLFYAYYPKRVTLTSPGVSVGGMTPRNIFCIAFDICIDRTIGRREQRR